MIPSKKYKGKQRTISTICTKFVTEHLLGHWPGLEYGAMGRMQVSAPPQNVWFYPFTLSTNIRANHSFYGRVVFLTGIKNPVIYATGLFIPVASNWNKNYLQICDKNRPFKEISLFLFLAKVLGNNFYIWILLARFYLALHYGIINSQSGWL